MSILYNVILFFEIMLFLTCSAWNTCQDGICFYSNETSSSSLTEAQNLCKQNGSKLLELYEESFQNAFKTVLNNWTYTTADSYKLFTNYQIWLNLMRVSSNWSWISGEKFNDLPSVEFNNQNEDYAVIKYETGNSKVIIRSTSAQQNSFFMCSYNNCKNSSCITFNTSTTKNWIDARYECSKLGMDLAVLNWVTNATKDLPELVQKYNRDEFFIGLSKKKYFWNESRIPLKFHNWLSGQPTDEQNCATIKSLNDFNWYSGECSKVSFLVVCMNDLNQEERLITTTTTTTTTTTSATTKITSNISSSSSTLLQSRNLGLGIGIPCLILLIIGLIIIGLYFYGKRTNRKIPQLNLKLSRPFAYQRHKSRDPMISEDPPTPHATETMENTSDTDVSHYATIGRSTHPGSPDIQRSNEKTLEYADLEFLSKKQAETLAGNDADDNENSKQINNMPIYSEVTKQENSAL